MGRTVEDRALEQVFILLDMIKNPDAYEERLGELRAERRKVTEALDKIDLESRELRQARETFENDRAAFETTQAAQRGETKAQTAALEHRERRLAAREKTAKDAQTEAKAAIAETDEMKAELQRKLIAAQELVAG